jgi:hypothetical protein
VDDLASMLSDQVRRTINAPWLLTGMDKSRAALSATNTTASDTIPEPGREETPILYARDPTAKAIPLVGNLDLAGTEGHIEALLRELERDYPELRFDNLRLTGQISGRTLEVARAPVETKVLQRRALYDDALVRAQNMALAIAGHRRQVEGFDLTSYAKGDLDHSIGPRRVFDTTEQDRAEDESAFWTAAGKAVDAGCPLDAYLTRQGWSPEEIAPITAALEREQRTPVDWNQTDTRGPIGFGALANHGQAAPQPQQEPEQ